MDNFRFKIYLKSNLQRLYRDEEGRIIWVDRKGREIAPEAVNSHYPALVPKLYTKAAHKSTPLYKDPQSSVIANHGLYAITNGLIAEDQNPGYTAVLETISGEEEGLAKFFDGIAVANGDKWKDAAPSYTSWRPLGNKENRSPEAEENTKVSDRVRQFAIDWYLKAEIKKLTETKAGGQKETSEGTKAENTETRVATEKAAAGKAAIEKTVTEKAAEKVTEKAAREKAAGENAVRVSYSDELYDQGLREAIKKAENYLKPFFAYDLDRIYSISWDPEEGGGTDRDRTTLSADTAEGEGQGQWHFAISERLPYGSYIIVEQQPAYAELGDLKNRHYAVDAPCEIQIPAVYGSYEEAVKKPQILSSYYEYHSSDTPQQLAAKYHIRFCEENHVIKAHNHSGDFEIYKYGMAIGTVTNGVSQTGPGTYFALTQSRYKPYLNYYNEDDDRTTGHVPYYLTEGMDGREGVSLVYRYSSVSETEEQGAMAGASKAYDGVYSHALVPWSMAMPGDEASDMAASPAGESSYQGLAYGIFMNKLYKSKLRIEKLDSETHENLLHDGAMFRIYRAQRDEGEFGTGRVKFYETETVIAGSREFLLGMGATNITRVPRDITGIADRYSGVVAAGTPVCREADQIVLTDLYGRKKGDFKAWTTTRDGLMREPEGTGRLYGDQNAGYLETPQALEAGVHVLVEVSPPVGYRRTKPVALEIYSDEIAYYREGRQEERILATVYRRAGKALRARKPLQARKPPESDIARIYIENTPIKLTVEKKKNLKEEVTFKLSGRVDGNLMQIGGDSAYEYAYSQGRYLGYGWKKGTLEYLNAWKDAGAQVKIVYQEGVFAGYGYVTVPSRISEDENPYVAGAVMTLYEGLELKPSGDSQDFAYEGLMIERNRQGNVVRMYVKEGYAGERTEFQKEESVSEPVKGVWDAVTVKRPDTDILYYDLGDLDVFTEKMMDEVMVRYGYDRDHGLVDLQQLEQDRRNTDQTDREHSVFAFKGGRPYLELTGGNFMEMSYSPTDKILGVPDGTAIYHIDQAGNRDARTDPYTGMAYVSDEQTGTIYVWPVTVMTDKEGRRIAADKITTCRVATIGEYRTQDATEDIVENTVEKIEESTVENAVKKIAENPAEETAEETAENTTEETVKDTAEETSEDTAKNTEESTKEEAADEEQGYLTGTWRADSGEESHHITTLVQNTRGENMDGEAISQGNNGAFEKYLRPVIDEYGLSRYYICSPRFYEKGTLLYDRDGDFVRRKSSDLLEAYRKASYMADGLEFLMGEEAAVYHRQGESYLVENTWVTGEKAPNDPFVTLMTQGQADCLKRIGAGTYIMEELNAPEGYVKGLPVGITVQETEELQAAAMEDDYTKILIRKLDSTEHYEYDVLDMGLKDENGRHPKIGTVSEGKGSFGHGQVPGAGISLYEAEKLDEGSPYRKTKRTGISWESGKEPVYLEQLKDGAYILEETVVPDGFVSGGPINVEISNTGEVQIVDVYNDHTKVEFEKYTIDGTMVRPVEGAGFTLYEAITDEDGQVIYDGGKPQYDKEQIIDTWKSSDNRRYRKFAEAFEELYREYGTSGRKVSWNMDGKEYRATYKSHQQIDSSAAGGPYTRFPTTADIRFVTDQGEEIRVVVYQQQDNGSGRDFTYEYQFDYRKLPHINDYAVSYVTLDGMRRMDYLPVGRKFVLVETDPPKGYGGAEARVVLVEDTNQIQRHRVLNQESRLLISKCGKEEGEAFQEGHIRELEGAHLVLYRADAYGELIQEPEYLAAEWISGSDGVYTEEDWVNGRIPAGYRAGDKKPHELRRLPDGVYYLVELKSPGYYTLMEPVKIVYTQQEQIHIIRVWNEMVQGELELGKTDQEGRPLEGAVFELTAYRGTDRGPILQMTLGSQNGIARISGLPVGERTETGKIVPYQYYLRETVPPKGYRADTQRYRVSFSPDKEGSSWSYREPDKKTITIVDEKTKISIKKQDFDSPKEWVAGAEMAVYHVTGRDEQGQYSYDEEAPEAVWITGEEAYILEGLVAGETYVLAERKAPPGFELMKPYAFTISADGRRICSITGALGMITVHSYEESDVIRAVEIQGRYGIRVEMELKDEKGEQVAFWVAGGDGRRLTQQDGIEDQQIYSLTETTVYSDGSREITGYTTRRCRLTKEGIWEIPDRRVKKVEMSLSHEDGRIIRRWNSSEIISRVQIDNPVSPERVKIRLRNRHKEHQEEPKEEAKGAVNAQEPVWTELICTNTGADPADMMVTVRPGSGVTVIDPGEGSLEHGQLSYLLEQVKPGQQRRITFASQIAPGTKAVTVWAVLECMGQRWEEQKSVPVLRSNQLTVYFEVTGTGKKMENLHPREFQVFLYTADGKELKGTYAYEGSRSGKIRSGQTLRLSANDYVTIDPGPFYKNIRYKILDLQSGESREGQVSAEQGGCELFSKEVTDQNQTAIFQKGNSYQLQETTCYSDGSVRNSQKTGFSIGDHVSVEGITVTDRKQTVSVSKRDADSQEELEKAVLQVKQEDGTVLEQWTSGKRPYRLQSVLTPGQTYQLCEVLAPDGYGYGKEIGFRIVEGECVNEIIMEDEKTRVIVSKKAITGEEELPGAVLQIFDENENLVEQWISGTSPHVMTGKLKAGGRYRLHEESPPDGYGYAEDCFFTVAEDGSVEMVEMRDAPTDVEVSKLGVDRERVLPGAELEILDREGRSICQWVSEEKPYRLKGILKVKTPYTLREKRPPEGYAWGKDVEFTVSGDGSRDSVFMNDEVTRLEIVKIDSETNSPLAGAKMELRTEEGQVIEKWISEEKPYIIEGKLKAGETYLVGEYAPPFGYRRMDEDIPVTIPRNAETVTIAVENEKLMPVTPIPEEEKGEEKTGRVYVDYWSAMAAHGNGSYRFFTNLGLPKLGDRGRNDLLLAWLMGVLGLYMVGYMGRNYVICTAFGMVSITVFMMISGRLKRDKKKKGKQQLWSLLIVSLILGTCIVKPVYAADVEVRPDGQIVVTGEVFLTPEELPEPLPDIYEYRNIKYERVSSQITTVMTERQEKEAEKTIVYEAVEQIDVLPDSTEIVVRDERYGTELRQRFPAVHVEFFDWRWVPGFQLPVIVEEADAQNYELNGILVPAREEDPFAGYEEELLKLAQVDPEYYRITKIRWAGEAWEGEEETLYRNALAEGEKYVADCRVTYGGTAVLEPVEGVAWQAVYEKLPGDEDDQEMTFPVGFWPETWRFKEPEASKPVWYQTSLGQMVISVGILVMLLPLLLILIKKNKKKRRQNKQKSFTK